MSASIHFPHRRRSDFPEQLCHCCAHDAAFVANGRVVDLEVHTPVLSVLLIPHENSAAEGARRLIMREALVASGATCELAHRAGSGIAVRYTFPARERFPELRYRTRPERYDTGEGAE